MKSSRCLSPFPCSGYCPSYPHSRAPVCKTCPSTDETWPRLAVVKEEVVPEENCNMARWLECINLGVFSCASCDERAGCHVNRAAKVYRSSYFYGAPIVVETEFADRLPLIDQAALRCEVFVHVRSSHPTPLVPGTTVSAGGVSAVLRLRLPTLCAP